jgi:hypothetical protein
VSIFRGNASVREREGRARVISREITAHGFVCPRPQIRLKGKSIVDQRKVSHIPTHHAKKTCTTAETISPVRNQPRTRKNEKGRTDSIETRPGDGRHWHVRKHAEVAPPRDEDAPHEVGHERRLEQLGDEDGVNCGGGAGIGIVMASG